MNWDLLMKDGTIVDGSGGKAFRGDVAVKDGKIAAVIPSQQNEGTDVVPEQKAERVFDAQGLTVCPGFIDMHSHADWIVPQKEHQGILKPLLEQGITTLIGGNCGYSAAPLAPSSPYLSLITESTDFLTDGPLNYTWDSMDSYLKQLNERGLALNLAMLTGHGTLRLSLLGKEHAYPGDEAMAKMERLVDESLEQGSCGLSFGLGYEPGIFSEMQELERLARRVQQRDRILTVHTKALSRISGAYPLQLFGGEAHNLKALQEMILLAERTGVRLQISHLIFVGRKSWPTVDRALEMIDEARERGVDLAFDSFPYMCGNTTIYVVYPAWFLNNIEQNFRKPAALIRLRLEAKLITSLLGFNLTDIQVLWGGHPDLEQYEGKFFDEIAREMGLPVMKAYLKVSELGKGKTLCLLHKYSGDEADERAYHKVLTHPLNLIETDTILTSKGVQNPASCGTFPRVIQRYHKELGLITLEEAVAKMTGNSARRFGLHDRGVLKEGNRADITIFDYAEIKDNTTLHQLEERPSGIKSVFINGIETVREGRALPGILAGQALRPKI